MELLWDYKFHNMTGGLGEETAKQALEAGVKPAATGGEEKDGNYSSVDEIVKMGEKR